MTKEVCPKCNKSLLGGLIYETFLVRCEGDKEWARELAATYGATEEEGRWEKTISIYDIDKDRTVEWMCPHCHYKWPA